MSWRDRLDRFVKSDREVPLLAGFSIGVYVIFFYLSHNFSQAASRYHWLFFLVYYLLFPMATLWIADRLSRKFLPNRRRQLLFTGFVIFFSWFVLQLLPLPYSYKRIMLAVALLAGLLSFKFSNYKMLLPLLWFMTLFPVWESFVQLSERLANDTTWKQQPDHITSARFKRRPNIYFIQMDGYPSPQALRDPNYGLDNTAHDRWLASQGFTLYDAFRSNYRSTLQSNASCFEMKHHFYQEDAWPMTDQDYIVGHNAALTTLKNNGYELEFISERPYLLMNRPETAYDYLNFQYAELPFLKDGWMFFKEIAPIIRERISRKSNSPRFFFIEKFDPGHIAVSQGASEGKVKEREKFVSKLDSANLWLQEMIPHIRKKDPSAIILIAADHGGYVGFDATDQAIGNQHTPELLRAMFGARLAIRWNDAAHTEYDAGLRTSVNTFRTLFAYLSGDKALLRHLQPDISYNITKEGPDGQAVPVIR